MYHNLRTNEEFSAIKDTVFDTAELKNRQRELQTEVNVITDMIETCIRENANTAQDQEEYQKHYDELAERFESTQEQLKKVGEEIAEKQVHGAEEGFLSLRRVVLR